MKKILLIALIMIFMGFEVQAATLPGAITKYKKGNYTGCINDLDDILISMSKKKNDRDVSKKVISTVSKFDVQKIINGDENENKKLTSEMKKIVKYDSTDSTKWAYIFYYYALSLHQIGNGSASNYYAVAKIFSPQSKIGQYADQAKMCLDAPGSCASSDIDEFIRSGKQVDDTIIKKELKDNLEKQREEINRGNGLSYGEDINTATIAWVDEGIPDINEIGKKETASLSNDMPTDEEIGRAVRTLQKAGINPVNYMNMPINNEYAQLNALLNDGNYNNNYSNDYATMMMMNSTNGKISPEVMQTIMRQQMMGSGYGF